MSFYIYVLEARELVVKENPSSQNALFQPRDSSDLTGPRAGSTERGDAEIRSAAHSERSSRTWPGLNKHQEDLSPPKGYPPEIDFQTLSTLSRLLSRRHVSPNRDQDRPVQPHDLEASGVGTAATRRNMFNSP